MTIERNILDKLSLVSPRMLTENVLWSDVRQDMPQASLTELRSAMRQLEAKSQIIVISNEDATRIKITTDGLARLAE